MAFGIDDALTAATSGIKLTDTIVKTIKNYRRSGANIDLEILLQEVKIMALQRIGQADIAIAQFERILVEKGVDLEQRLYEVISRTSFWNPLEQYQLRNLQKIFNSLSDSIYNATDDIAALARCHDDTGPMGQAVVESAESKHQLNSDVISAPSLRAALNRLREELKRQKAVLMEL